MNKPAPHDLSLSAITMLIQAERIIEDTLRCKRRNFGRGPAWWSGLAAEYAGCSCRLLAAWAATLRDRK